ncbi:MAG: class I SAM-dependent methyltransferase, partial [Eubacterium sp.]|nr:class I SAM-dependent methyltransferase [Eubacterium sp.]
EAAAAGRKNECADPESGAAPDILYLQQDMREFELYGTVRAIVCVCDSLNYILEEEEILKVFRLVRNYLDPGGLFVFDFHTPSFYAGIGEETIAENRPEGSFIWENSYDQETQLNRYDLTLFLPEENGFYSKSEETHLERGYTEETMRKLLAEAGLICEEIRPALGEESGRLFAAASVPFLKQ